MTTLLHPLHELFELLPHIDEQLRTKMEALDTDTLCAVLRAVAVSAVEGDTPGFGAAAEAEGVRKHNRIVRAVARPVKRRQAPPVDWPAVHAALAKLQEPAPVPAPVPELAHTPAPPPTPPASDARANTGSPQASQAPRTDAQEVDEHEGEGQPSRTRTHARTHARESDSRNDHERLQDPSNEPDDEDMHPEVSRAAEAAGALEDMIGEGRLTEQQALAAIHVGMGVGYTQTSKLVGCDRTTLYGWRQTANFQEAVSRVTSYLARRLLEEIEGAQRLALDTLREGLSAMKPTFGGGLVPDWQARQRCADSLLDRGGKLLKGETLQVNQKVTHALDEDLEAKLAELEAERLALEAEQEAIDAEFAELRLLEGGAGSEDAA